MADKFVRRKSSFRMGRRNAAFSEYLNERKEKLKVEIQFAIEKRGSARCQK